MMTNSTVKVAVPSELESRKYLGLKRSPDDLSALMPSLHGLRPIYNNDKIANVQVIMGIDTFHTKKKENLSKDMYK